jgi:integral membrane sensor domain MASE1
MKKKPTLSPEVDELRHNSRPLLRTALIVAAYLFTFIILDLFSQQFEELRGIVAWYPPAGLTYTLLLVFGVRFTPAVTIALFISSLFIYHMPQSPYLLFLWALIISLIYGAAAAFLRHRIRFDWQLRKMRDVIWLVFTTVFVSALLAVLSVSSSALSSDMPRSEVLGAIFHWWIGETVGVLTVTPFLLIHVMPGLKRFVEGQPVKLPARRSFPRPTLSVIGQVFSLAFIIYWVFGSRVLNEFRPMYLISLPLIWIALDHGFKGVTTGIMALNFGVMLAMWFFRFDLA